MCVWVVDILSARARFAPATFHHAPLQARPRHGQLWQPSDPIFGVLLRPVSPVGRVRQIQARGHRLKTPRPTVSLRPQLRELPAPEAAPLCCRASAWRRSRRSCRPSDVRGEFVFRSPQSFVVGPSQWFSEWAAAFGPIVTILLTMKAIPCRRRSVGRPLHYRSLLVHCLDLVCRYLLSLWHVRSPIPSRASGPPT